METKTLAFDVRDIEQFKEIFPDFKSGKMSGRELGNKLLEVLQDQVATPEFMHLQQELQDSINVKNELQERLQANNQQVAELQDRCNQLEAQLAEKVAEKVAEKASTSEIIDLQQKLQDRCDQLEARLAEKLAETTATTENKHMQQELQAMLQDLQGKNATLEARCKELKLQLKEALNHQDAYAFTPYFKQLIEVMTVKINDISKTTYSTTDVIMQSLFATYFNSHTSIRYTYPMSKGELLALAQQYYPELRNEKELFNLMVHKIKEEES
jgi:DNA repair exonuclease SbcCD ATPase subunit